MARRDGHVVCASAVGVHQYAIVERCHKSGIWRTKRRFENAPEEDVKDYAVKLARRERVPVNVVSMCDEGLDVVWKFDRNGNEIREGRR